MKKLLNPQIQAELELNRPAKSVWERVFRFGVGYLIITTLVGKVAEVIFGEENNESLVEPLGLDFHRSLFIFHALLFELRNCTLCEE